MNGTIWVAIDNREQIIAAVRDHAYLALPLVFGIGLLKSIVLDYPDMHRFDVYAVGTPGQLERAHEHFVREGLHGARWFASEMDA